MPHAETAAPGPLCRLIPLLMLLPLSVLEALADAQPRFETLENGLRIVLIEERAAPLVSVQLWLRFGSLHDDPQRPGLSHIVRTWLEHRDDAALRLRASGADHESRTLRDACYFASLAPSAQLDALLEIERERLAPRTPTPVELAQALHAARMQSAHAVADDLRGGRAAPREAAWPAPARGGVHLNEPEYCHLLAELFGDGAARHPPGVIDTDFQTPDTLEFAEFVERQVVPANATLLLIGDFDPPAVLERVRARFAVLPWRPAPPPRPFARATLRAARLHSRIAGRPVLTWALVTGPAGQLENAQLDLLAQRCCEHFAGAATARWQHLEWRDAGILLLQHAPLPDPIAGAAQLTGVDFALLHELQRAANHPAAPEVHQRARQRLALDLLQQRDGFAQRASRIAWFEMIAGDLLLESLETRRIEQLGTADVRAAAARLFALVEAAMRRAPLHTLARAPEPPPPQPTKYLEPLSPQRVSATEALRLLTRAAPAANAPQVAAANLSWQTCAADALHIAPCSPSRPLSTAIVRPSTPLDAALLAAPTLGGQCGMLQDLLAARRIQLELSPNALIFQCAHDALPAALEIAERLAQPHSAATDRALTADVASRALAALPFAPAEQADALARGVWRGLVEPGSAERAAQRSSAARSWVLTPVAADELCAAWSALRAELTADSAELTKDGATVEPASASSAGATSTTPATSDSAAAERAAGSRIFWLASEAQALELRVVIRLDDDAAIDAEGLLCALGAPAGLRHTSLDATRSRAWLGEVLDPQAIMLATCVPQSALANAIVSLVSPEPALETQPAVGVAADRPVDEQRAIAQLHASWRALLRSNPNHAAIAATSAPRSSNSPMAGVDPRAAAQTVQQAWSAGRCVLVIVGGNPHAPLPGPLRELGKVHEVFLDRAPRR